VLYYFYKRNAPFNYQLTNDSDQMDSLPDHASEEIKKLVKDCLAFDKTNRPDAKSIFRQSLAHITEKERMLASVEILTSSSEAEARETTSSVSAKDSATPWSADKKPLVDKLSKDQKNTAQPALSTSEKEPTVPAVNLWAERAKKQKSANREKAGGDDMTTSLRPLGAGGPPSDIRERIGSLVIDYERLTPREVFMPSIPFSAKKIEMELLAEDFQYDNSFVQPESGPSRSSSRLDFLRPTLRHSSTSTEVSISIKADNCEEFYLSNSEEYFKTLLLRKEIENWIYRQDQMGKTVYLVVGYICYQNALVEEASAHERTETMGAKSQISSENSAMAALSPPAHTTASLSTSSSASDNRLCKSSLKCNVQPLTKT
jgi:serine/threonine protein kinase